MGLLILLLLVTNADRAPTKLGYDQLFVEAMRRLALPSKPRQEDETPRVPPRTAPTLSYDQWSVEAGYRMRFLSGQTKVREFDSTPIWLDLRDDLGLEDAGAPYVKVMGDSPGVRWQLEAEFFRCWGEGMVSHDFDYDEDSFAGGTPFETFGEFIFVRATASIKRMLWSGDDGWLGPVFGLEYARMRVGIEQPLSGRHSTEDYHEFLPYPVLGFAGEWRLTPDLVIGGSVMGGWMPRVPTGRVEGGMLYMITRSVVIEARCSYHLDGPFFLTGSVQYQYWYGELKSIEDGNELLLNSLSFAIGLEVRW